MAARLLRTFVLMLMATSGAPFAPTLAGYVSRTSSKAAIEIAIANRLCAGKGHRSGLCARPSRRGDARYEGRRPKRSRAGKVVGARKGMGTASPRRVPPNKRTALRWVVQGVERILSSEDPDGGGEKVYERLKDASLVDALYQIVDANNQKDILDASECVQILTRRPSDYPAEVIERTIKVTAMAGLASASLDLLRATLREEGRDDLPSSIAYIAVMDVLRNYGRIEAMEDFLAELGGACRRIDQRNGGEGGEEGRRRPRVDVVAFNVYLAALCDAASEGAPFSSTADREAIATRGGGGGGAASLDSATTSSREKYLYKASNLLLGDVARDRFALASDPDAYSHNSVLAAAAKICESGDDGWTFASPVVTSTWDGMRRRKIDPDVFAYNARIRAALASDEGEVAADLVEQLRRGTLEPDRYTIDLMLRMYLDVGRRDEARDAMARFYEENAEADRRVVEAAFEAFLNTIVSAGEVEFAHDVFQTFFLPAPKRKRRMEMSQTIRVLSEEERQSRPIEERRQGTTSHPRTSGEGGRMPSPTIRHFNVLLGGYSKAYQSAVSRIGKSNAVFSKREQILDELANVANVTVPIHRAYDLLDAMIRTGVPLDTFSVTSLMSLPSTPENITALLTRVEPEMMTDLNPAAYRSIITAYGRAGDPSSACWMFEEMVRSCRNQGRTVEGWNVVLGALAKCAGDGTLLDVRSSGAARDRGDDSQSPTEDDPLTPLIASLVEGKTCWEAALSIVDVLRDRVELPTGLKAPRPNSQTYCLVASALSKSGTSKPKPDRALRLFRTAMDEGVVADGRFLNAVLRCFGDDVEGALAAWKSDVGPAAAGYERTGGKGAHRGANLMAAYNGLMHVCGRAVRPDVATRIAYAMNKAGVEPTEVTLNSYLAGKRGALDGNDAKGAVLRDQYESLLSVECTKYNIMDKRRAKDRKIRIILP